MATFSLIASLLEFIAIVVLTVVVVKQRRALDKRIDEAIGEQRFERLKEEIQKIFEKHWRLLTKTLRYVHIRRTKGLREIHDTLEGILEDEEASMKSLLSKVEEQPPEMPPEPQPPPGQQEPGAAGG